MIETYVSIGKVTDYAIGVLKYFATASSILLISIVGALLAWIFLSAVGMIVAILGIIVATIVLTLGIYARLMGYTNEQLYNLSQKIINGSPNCFFGEAYNVSYTDVYDFASAGNKKSLKKLEIEMGNLTDDDLKKKGFSDEKIRIIKAGTHHQELGLPCIEHCATARAYGRFKEAGVRIKMADVAAGISKSKEEKDNVEKGLN